MADTIRTDKETKEYFDDEATLQKKVAILAKLIKKSKHFIAFTGAGVSTSAGIPDFRSGVDTVLETGAGKWTKEAAIKKGMEVKQPKKVTQALKAFPTPTHMSLVKLVDEGHLKFLISQNTDGLHRRSGFPPELLAELHGNSNLEICEKCGKHYLRDFRCRNARKTKSHFTGRICTVPECGGRLYDTIINFGENLPEKELEAAEIQSSKADLCLAMGSSLTVVPAADFPKRVGIAKDLVIVNLQKTPLDKYAHTCIYGKCDDVMKMLMKELKVDIPEWRLTRYFKICVEPTTNSKDTDLRAKISGLTVDGAATSLFTSVSLTMWGEKKTKEISIDGLLLHEAEFTGLSLQPTTKKENDNKEDEKKEESKSAEFLVELGFSGHYEEPPFVKDLGADLGLWKKSPSFPLKQIFKMVYNPFTKTWTGFTQKELEKDEAAKLLELLKI